MYLFLKYVLISILELLYIFVSIYVNNFTAMPEFKSHLENLEKRIQVANGGKPTRLLTYGEQKLLFAQINEGMTEFIQDKKRRDLFADQELKKVVL